MDIRDPGLNYTEEGLVTTRMLVLVFGLILRMLGPCYVVVVSVGPLVR